jgi:hypothetical protein
VPRPASWNLYLRRDVVAQAPYRIDTKFTLNAVMMKWICPRLGIALDTLRG